MDLPFKVFRIRPLIKGLKKLVLLETKNTIFNKCKKIRKILVHNNSSDLKIIRPAMMVLISRRIMNKILSKPF